MAVNFFPEDSGSSGSGGGGTGNYIPLTQKGSANGVATLDASAKVPSSQLPDISITNTFVVATEVEMLALNAQTGDIAVRTDVNKTFILKTSPASVIGNWVELPTPTNGVFSVDGKTGAVTLTNTYQAKSNELTALSALTDTPGFIKKVGDGVYAVDTTAYLSTIDASIFYQPLNTNLTSISGITGPYGFLVKTVNGWELNTSGYQHASPLLTGIANLAGDGYLEKVGTGWVLNPGPFQPLDINLTGISAIDADGFLTRTNGVWAMDSNRYQYANNELSGFSALPDDVGLVKKTGDGTYVLDTNTYLTTTASSTTYQPLHPHLTGISGLVGTSGVPKLIDGTWSLDATSYLTQNEVITLSGDVTGSGRTAITTTLATIGAGGTFPKITFNTKGLVTGGAILAASDIPVLDWSKITTGKPTTIAGYGITDAYTKTEVDNSLATKQPLNNELTALSALPDTAGLVRKTGDGTYTIDSSVSFTVAGNGLTSTGNTVNVVGTAGRIVSNADAIDLALAGTAGTYTKVVTDSYGRVIGSEALVAADIPVLPATSITNTAVTLSDTQTISGAKTFTNPVYVSRASVQFVLHQSGVTQPTCIFSNQSGLFYLFVTDPNANISTTINSLRPLTINLSTGLLNSANGQNFAGGLTSSGAVSVTNTTASTSTTTGAFKVSGGVGVQGKVYADTVNAVLHLRKLTNATRPTPSEEGIGKMWANSDTGHIEVIVSATEIKAIAWQPGNP